MASQVPPKTHYDSQYPSGDALFSSTRFRQNFQALYAGDFLPARPIAKETPNMTISVLGSDASGYQRGVYYGSNDQRISLSSGETPAMSAPAANPRIDVIYLTPSGDIGIKTGTEAASPTIPDISESGDRLPVCAIYHRTTSTKIVNFVDRLSYTGDSYIMADLRPMYQIPRSDISSTAEDEVFRNSKNIMLNRLKIMELHNLTVGQFVDGWADDFQDSTGIALSSAISGDLLIAGDKLRYSRNYAHQGTPNFNVIRSPSGSSGGSSGTVTLLRPSGIQASKLKGYWKLSEASGTRADSSGNGNNLSDNNTVGSNSENYWGLASEYVADFEASSSEYLSITNAAQTGLNMTGSLSVFARFKAEALGASMQILSKLDVAGLSGYAVGVGASGQLFMTIESTTYNTATNVVAAGAWCSIGYVYDTTNNVIIFYFNGNCVEVVSCTGNVTSNSAEFRIGRTGAGAASDQYLDGMISDVAIWNDALTPSEIKSLALGVEIENFDYRPGNIGTAPTAWWKLNEISGTRASQVGSFTLTDGNTVLAGAGYLEGIGAAFVSASSEYLYCADDPALDLTTSYSIVAWVKFSGTIADEMIVGKWASNAGYFFSISASGMRAYHDASLYEITTGVNFYSGAWYHVAVVFDTTANTVKFYQDGVLVGTVASATTDPSNTATQFCIGQRGDNADYLNGNLQDVAIWKGYTLTEAEIKSLACGMPLQPQGWVSYWKCDGASGNLVDALSVNELTDGNTVGSATGQVSNGRDFEASNTEYFSISDVAQTDLDLTGRPMSFVGWLKPESLAADMAIWEKDYSVNGHGAVLRSTGLLNFYVRNNLLASATTLSTGTFAHVGFTFDEIKQRVYVAGREDANGASANAILNSSEDFRIGIRSSSLTLPFDGVMDELIIAKRALSADEVKAIACKGKCGKEATSTESAVAGGGAGGSGGDGKAVVICGKQAFDLLASNAALVVVTKSGKNVTAEISRNSGDTWNSVPLTEDFFDGTRYYLSGLKEGLAGTYPAGTGDYYLTLVIPSGDPTEIEAYSVSLS